MGGMQTGGNLNDFSAISGYTNTNGEYVKEGICTNRIRCDITKVGYFKSELLLTNYGYSYDVKSRGRALRKLHFGWDNW